MIQDTVNIIRRWGSDIHPLAQLVAANNQIKYGEVTVDPADLATVTDAETTVDLPEGTAAAGDLVIVFPPATLTKGLVLMGSRISDTDELKIRLYNSTGVSINMASGTWSYLIITPPQLVVL